MTQCPSCNTEHNSPHCPNCGFGARDTLRTCPRCGKQSNYNHCPDCGEKLAGAAVPALALPLDPARARRLIFIVLSVFIVFLALCVAVPLAMRSMSSPSPSTDTTAEPQILQGEGDIGDYYVKILSLTRGEGRHDDVFVVTYEWTNNSDRDQTYGRGAYVNLYQNSVQLGRAFGPPGEDSTDKDHLVFLPGTTVTIQEHFKQTGGWEGPFHVELSRTDRENKVVMIFEELTEAQP